MPDHSEVRSEFERTAASFAERTSGRFDHLGVVSFAGVERAGRVLEVGAGTGNFLSLFEDVAERLVAVDVTPAMLLQGRARHPGVVPVVAEGERLPLRSRSIDLVTCAQMLHHVAEPVRIVSEMRRVVTPGGRVLVVDQVATERFEEAVAMTELELMRDPSHASSRPPSALRTIVAAVGLEVLDHRVVARRERFSQWTPEAEFPPERIERLLDFIERRGAETGMEFEREGDDYSFTRRRMMLLAARGDG